MVSSRPKSLLEKGDAHFMEESFTISIVTSVFARSVSTGTYPFSIHGVWHLLPTTSRPMIGELNPWVSWLWDR